MTEISFKSTFRIPIKQHGITNAKKKELIKTVQGYKNSLLPTGKESCVRVSMPNKDDEKFMAQLKAIGYKVYKVFNGENIPKTELDNYIKQELHSSCENIGPVTKPLNRDQIRKKESYIEMCEQYGKDFAEAVFFNDKVIK